MVKKTITAWVAVGSGDKLYVVDESRSDCVYKLDRLFGHTLALLEVRIVEVEITWEDK